MKKKLLMGLFLFPLIFSCSNGVDSSKTFDSEEKESSSLEEVDEFIEVKWNKGDKVNKEISTSGTFIDVAIGEILSVGCSYTFGYKYTSGSASSSRVEVSSNGVCKITSSVDNSFTLKGLRQGETILKLYDVDGVLRYRNKITFRNILFKEEMLDFIVNKVDHYESQYAKGMNIYFTSSSTGQVTGKDGNDELTAPITFGFEYSGTFGEYEYKLTVTDYDASSSGTTLVLNTIYVNKNGYAIHPCTSDAVVDYFIPVFQE